MDGKRGDVRHFSASAGRRLLHQCHNRSDQPSQSKKDGLELLRASKYLIILSDFHLLYIWTVRISSMIGGHQKARVLLVRSARGEHQRTHS